MRKFVAMIAVAVFSVIGLAPMADAAPTTDGRFIIQGRF